MSRPRRTVVIRAVVILVVGAMFASACGGSDPGSQRSGASETPPETNTTATTVGSGPVSITGPILEESFALAQRLVDRLGDEDTAVDALFIGTELGYSAAQLLAGVESGNLQADGAIQDVQPHGPRLGRIDLGVKSGQASDAGKVTKRPAAAKTALMRFQNNNDDKLLLERLREAAASTGAFEFEQQQVLGLHGVSLIILLLKAGMTPEQVIDALILGVYFYENNGVCYSRALPFSTNEPQVRTCDGAAAEASSSADPVVEQDAPEAALDPVRGAQFVGSLDGVLVDDPESTITVTISPEGVVSGQLDATEQLDNYLASVSLCGILGESDEECGDSTVECPATVLWSSDLSTLQFAGTPPDQGAVSGTIAITWDTTPRGCGEPITEVITVDIEATVSPGGALITMPVEISLVRVEPEG